MNKTLKYNILGNTGLSVSEVGFGAYRVDVKSPTNKEALKQAILAGINLIDTSSTYTDGNSELLVGQVLKELSPKSTVIVTKGGYLQGQNFELSQLRKSENNPFPDLVECQKGLEHCIHPEFLEDQITRSLGRLGVETIDVYLLHNPEYYLKWAKNKGIELVLARKEYYSRIKKAFVHLEKEVEKGRIRHYGISSNTFPVSSEDYDFTSLVEVIRIAEEISPNHHFSVIEFPMNLAETSASTRRNQPNNMSLLDLAKQENLGVLINRPLNVFFEGSVIQLAEPKIDAIPLSEDIEKELKRIRQFEKLISNKLQEYTEEIQSNIENNLFVFDELQNNWMEFKNISHWQAALNQFFMPRLYYSKNFIQKSQLDNSELELDLFNYAFKTNELLSIITNYYNNEHLKLLKKIKNNLPELASAKNMSNMAVRALRSTSGITTVLVGMVQPEYVSDIIDELKVPVEKNFNCDKVSFNEIVN